MERILVDDRQAQIIRSARGKIEVRGPHGEPVGYVVRVPSQEEIEKAARRTGQAPVESVSRPT